jgi:hypothetical protein
MSLYQITNNFGNRNVDLYVNSITCNEFITTDLSTDQLTITSSGGINTSGGIDLNINAPVVFQNPYTTIPNSSLNAYSYQNAANLTMSINGNFAQFASSPQSLSIMYTRIGNQVSVYYITKLLTLNPPSGTPANGTLVAGTLPADIIPANDVYTVSGIIYFNGSFATLLCQINSSGQIIFGDIAADQQFIPVIAPPQDLVLLAGTFVYMVDN